MSSLSTHGTRCPRVLTASATATGSPQPPARPPTWAPEDCHAAGNLPRRLSWGTGPTTPLGMEGAPLLPRLPLHYVPLWANHSTSRRTRRIPPLVEDRESNSRPVSPPQLDTLAPIWGFGPGLLLPMSLPPPTPLLPAGPSGATPPCCPPGSEHHRGKASTVPDSRQLRTFTLYPPSPPHSFLHAPPIRLGPHLVPVHATTLRRASTPTAVPPCCCRVTVASASCLVHVPLVTLSHVTAAPLKRLRSPLTASPPCSESSTIALAVNTASRFSPSSRRSASDTEM